MSADGDRRDWRGDDYDSEDDSSTDERREKTPEEEDADEEARDKIGILCAGQPQSGPRKALRKCLWPKTHRQMLLHQGIPLPINNSPFLVDWFDWLALFIIFVNTITLAMSDPLDPGSEMNEVLDILDICFNSFFVLEVMLRITAFGFVIYKADKWNVLDLLIVISGVVSSALQFFNITPFSLTSLRSVRVLRPIRSLRQFESARVVITAAISAISSLADVTLLYILFLVLFGVAGVSQYNSRLRTRCVNSMWWNENITSQYPQLGVADYVRFQGFEQAYNAPRYENITQFMNNWTCYSNLAARIPNETIREWYAINNYSHLESNYFDYYPCTSSSWNFTYDLDFNYSQPSYGDYMDARSYAPPSAENVEKWAEQTCDGTQAVVLVGYKCPSQYQCVRIANPYFGFIGFDNLAQALLTLFISVTLEMWYEAMYMTMDAVDPTAAIYFCLVVILGAFFIINLSIVLITVQFQRCAAEERQNALTSSKGMDAASKGLYSWISMKYKQIFGKKKKGGGTTSVGTPNASFASPTSRATSESGYSAGRDDGRESGLEGSEMKSVRNLSSLSRDESAAPDGGGESSPQPRAQGVDRLLEIPDEELSPIELQMKRQRIRKIERDRAVEEEMERRRQQSTLRRTVYGLLNSKIGKSISYGIIIANVIMMSTEHYGMGPTMVSNFEKLNLAFNILYTIELLLRLFSTPFLRFIRNKLDLMDIPIVILSWVDFAEPSFNFAAIRAFRCFRLLKMFRDIPEMYMWLKVILRSLSSSMVLGLMIAFCLFIFACLGMHLFGGFFCNLASNSPTADVAPDNTVASCPDRPRLNYDDIVAAMITSFVVMTGDNWEEVLFDGMRSRSTVFALFFVIFFIVSNYILLNLLIGILLSVRPASEDEEDSDDEDDEGEKKTDKALIQRINFERKEEEYIPDITLQSGLKIQAIQPHEDEQIKKEHAMEIEEEQSKVLTFVTNAEDRLKDKVMNNKMIDKIKGADDQGPNYTGIEKALQKFLTKGIVQQFIIVVIIFSCLALAFESPLAAPNTTQANIIRIVDFGLNVVFVLEVLLNFIAYGVILKPWCYLRRDHWNKMDFVLACTAIAGEALTRAKKGDNTAAPLKALRVFRAVRPLRFVKRAEGLKIVVSTLYQSFKPLKNLMLVILLMLTLWGIMGVQLFKGTFYRCSDQSFVTEVSCIAAGHAWQNARMHFDHLPAAYLSLFTLSTLENWVPIMFDGMDAVAPGIAPRTNFARRSALYFISFVVVGGVFFVNLIVSIIIDSYQKEKKASKKSGSVFLTPAQNAWIKTQHILVNTVPLIDYDEYRRDTKVGNIFVRMRKRVRAFVRNPLFDVAVYCAIIVNFLVMAIDQYPKPEVMAIFISICNVFFTTLFAVEASMKIISEGLKRYLSSKWNKFDFALVALSVIALLMELAFASATFAASFRTMRTLRLLRIIRKSRRLQIVLKKFLLALYSLNNVAAVVILLFFIFGVLGMKLFGRVERGLIITHWANFENIGNSMLLMLRVATGGNWVDVMDACRVEKPNCDSQIDGCGLSIITELYFVTFLVLGMFLLVNLFVAVIMENFSGGNSENQLRATEYIPDSDGVQFFKLWLHFDPERTYRMHAKYLLTFLRAIPPECRLGFGKMPEKQRLRRELVFVESLNLQEHDGMIELQDLIMVLCERAFCRGLNPEIHLKKKKKKEHLPIKLGKKLGSKTERRFRRDERDYSKPQSCRSVDTTRRVAVMIFEAYYSRHRHRVLHDRVIWAANRKRAQEQIISEGNALIQQKAQQAKMLEALAQADKNQEDDLMQSADLNKNILELARLNAVGPTGGGAFEDNKSLRVENQSIFSMRNSASIFGGAGSQTPGGLTGDQRASTVGESASVLGGAGGGAAGGYKPAVQQEDEDPFADLL